MLPATALPTESPLPRPPPGPTYVTVEPVELSFRLFVASVIIAFLVLVTLVLRVVSRFWIALKLGWDDTFVFAASVFSFGQTVLFALLVFGGLGHHAPTVPAPNQFSIPKILFSFELFHIISLNLGKISALFFYLKLFSQKSVAKITKWCLLAVSLGTIGLILWQFLFCRPLSKMWEWDGLETCGDRQPLYVAVCVWSIFTDLLVLVVPLPVIWRLKMERTQKLRLSWLFAAGLSVTAASVVRLAYIVTINYHNDFSFHSVPSTFLAFLEPPLTIICVSLPMLYSFLSKVWPGSKGRNASTPHGGPHRSHTYASSFARRVDPGKRNFTPLETTKADPFELNDIPHGTERRVQVSTKNSRGDRMLGKSIDRDSESTSGSEHALVEPVPYDTSQQMGGIMVSKNFTVSVTQRE
ncbi:hypothetical protein F5B22DRAFT_592897 [Xylaria bambusicola]|uniref:uncharacterized protein n=1 Tax=Xylaria bambusicola TaxID=326684 RepID=UPI002008BED7|nr:uncharacterized protein F5B22DRAFT_592897 [Xylaria bambusicola]KAI0522123.1 hypothetical protein F5B22DRAFT_592897 [Xylaria bambusicola]